MGDNKGAQMVFSWHAWKEWKQFLRQNEKREAEHMPVERYGVTLQGKTCPKAVLQRNLVKFSPKEVCC